MTHQNTPDSAIKETGLRAFQAWQKGELTGDYSDFLASPEAFDRFSHPVSPRGVHYGEEGAAALVTLITERTGSPNHLSFTNVLLLEGENGQVGFLFDSQGTI